MASDGKIPVHDLRMGPTVDQLIKELRPLGQPAPPAPPPPMSLPTSTPTPIVVAKRKRRPLTAPTGAWLVWICVGLGLMLSVALARWPYAKDCGWRLGFYLYAVTMLIVAGIWGQLVAWKARLGFAHSVALTTMLWGFGLAAQSILPRIGYARDTSGWSCKVTPAELHRSEVVTEPAPEAAAPEAHVPAPATPEPGLAIGR